MKNTKQRVLTIALAAAVLAGTTGAAFTAYNYTTVSVSAAETKTSGNFNYEELSDGTVCITGTSITKGDLNIPTEIDGKTVSEIKSYAFNGKTGLQLVFIPNTVKKIGSGAFSGCTGIQNLKIDNGVELIERGAFYGCVGLTELTIPNSVKKIDGDEYIFGGAFQG